uniref:Uncharacterized protein n=1 Tax=Anguilla anguilla TaxID=7936 RepID=A0A0E9PEA7_ANGAN
MACCEFSHWRNGIFPICFDAPEQFGNFVTCCEPKWEGSRCWECVSQYRMATV